MARTRMQTCKSIMARLRAGGLEHGCNRKELLDAIVAEAGSTKETREHYVAELKRHRFIRQNGVGKYALNHESAEENLDLTLIGDLTVRVDLLEVRIADLEQRTGGDGDE